MTHAIFTRLGRSCPRGHESARYRSGECAVCRELKRRDDAPSRGLNSRELGADIARIVTRTHHPSRGGSRPAF